MPYLMNHSPYRGIEYLLPVDLWFIPISKLLIPSYKRKNSYSCSVSCPAIDIIPVRSRVYIVEGNSHNTISVFWNTLFHIVQNISAKELISKCILSMSNIWNLFEEVLLWENLHYSSCIKHPTKNYQPIHKLAIKLSKG
jgi:hypothetical protein